MQKIEISLWVALVLGLLLKLLHLPGYSIFIVFPLLLLSTIYFLFSFFLFNKITFKGIFKLESYKLPVVKLLHAFISGIGLSILMIGILYKLMHYNGGNFFLYNGLIICALTLLWLFFIKKTVSYENFNIIALRFFVSISIGIILLIHSLV